MTEKLYLTDSYLKEFDATVVSVNDKFVVLDKTAFYPQGGGQPSDSGKIFAADGASYSVVFAKKLGNDVSLELDKPGLKVEEKVHCIVDWEKRYRHMRMHSAAHIIHGVTFNEAGLLISGNQLGWPQSRIDINIENFDKEKFSLIEEKCNAVIARNLPVSFEFISKEQAKNSPDYFRLMGVNREELIEKLGNEIRILKIGDFDESIDGGTHVKNTKEIGKIKFVRFENKGATNRRIYFELLG
jgi:misacylated tRNA(Ala) deacylase